MAKVTALPRVNESQEEKELDLQAEGGAKVFAAGGGAVSRVGPGALAPGPLTETGLVGHNIRLFQVAASLTQTAITLRWYESCSGGCSRWRIRLSAIAGGSSKPGVGIRFMHPEAGTAAQPNTTSVRKQFSLPVLQGDATGQEMTVEMSRSFFFWRIINAPNPSPDVSVELAKSAPIPSLVQSRKYPNLSPAGANCSLSRCRRRRTGPHVRGVSSRTRGIQPFIRSRRGW